MRVRLAALLLALAIVPAASAALPFKATLKTPSTQPRINVKWRYSVRVTDRAGHLIGARLTVQLADPLGGVHPAQYDNTKRNIVNFPFHGIFRDYFEFPADSRGVQLTLRFTVKAKGAKTVLKRTVIPR